MQSFPRFSLALAGLSVACASSSGVKAPSHSADRTDEPATAAAPEVSTSGTQVTPPAQVNAPTSTPVPPAGPQYPFEIGTYEQPHIAFAECDKPDPCEVEVKDVLTLSAAADGALGVSIEVTQDNGHSCNFEGVLSEIAPELWGWADEGQHCRIELKFENASFTLTSDGCREDYCGARAHLLGTFSQSGLTKESP